MTRGGGIGGAGASVVSTRLIARALTLTLTKAGGAPGAVGGRVGGYGCAAACEGTLLFFRDNAAVRTTRQSSGMGTKPMRAQTAPEPWHTQGGRQLSSS